MEYKMTSPKPKTKIDLVLESLQQPSTYKGLLMLAALAGFKINEDQYSNILGGIVVVYSLIAIFWQDS